jgi:hypothetical protein
MQVMTSYGLERIIVTKKHLSRIRTRPYKGLYAS